jgi:ADP-L-glycero-D-manno-heptose 6-epimerase
MMKKILITGTNGFIGSKLKEKLVSVGHELYELNEDYFDLESWFSELYVSLRRIKYDVVFHVGACSDTLEKDVDYMMTRNYESTKIITDYCKENNIPLIYSSSAANYGINNNYPSNLYGWSKYVAEGYVISNGGIGLRYFNVYGPGEENKGKMASVAYQMYKKNLNGEIINIFPKKPLRDFVYVKDVISANIYAWKKYNDLKGCYYEVGSGDARPFEDVLSLLDIQYGYTDENSIPEGYQFYTCSNNNKWMIGWKPEWNLDSGLKDYKKMLDNENI